MPITKGSKKISKASRQSSQTRSTFLTDRTRGLLGKRRKPVKTFGFGDPERGSRDLQRIRLQLRARNLANRRAQFEPGDVVVLNAPELGAVGPAVVVENGVEANPLLYLVQFQDSTFLVPQAAITSGEGQGQVFEGDTGPEESMATEAEEARGDRVKDILVQLIEQVDDTAELAGYFDEAKEAFGLQEIGYRNLGENSASLFFKINPEFEIKLAGSNLEMRGEGTGSNKFKTKVRWKTDTLTLDGNGPYRVGTEMLANPLSQDHPTGSKSTADKTQKWMSQLMPTNPAAFPGKENRFIRGHLLNDHLGGIAIESNLFPITGKANEQHSLFAEQFIKSGVDNGYVYAYEVKVDKKSEGQIGTTGRYEVESDLKFAFARLDPTLQPIAATEHQEEVVSKLGVVGPDPFDRATEFAADFSSPGNSSNPGAKAVGGEAINTVSGRNPVASSNTGIDVQNISAFTLGLPDASPFSLGTSQSIHPAPTKSVQSQKVSLNSSTVTALQAKYTDLVTGWTATDIASWINAVRTGDLKRWNAVEAEAVKNKLDPAIAMQLFAPSGLGRRNATIK